MANLEFNQQDITSLVDKVVKGLDPTKNPLTEQERMLLVAIFAAAASQAAPSPPGAAVLKAPEIRGQKRGAGSRKGQPQLTAEQLREQLLKGYVPGKNMDTATHIDKKVVGIPKIPPGP
jgi:hypothetical protein